MTALPRFSTACLSTQPTALEPTSTISITGWRSNSANWAEDAQKSAAGAWPAGRRTARTAGARRCIGVILGRGPAQACSVLIGDEGAALAAGRAPTVGEGR